MTQYKVRIRDAQGLYEVEMASSGMAGAAIPWSLLPDEVHQEYERRFDPNMVYTVEVEDAQ